MSSNVISISVQLLSPEPEALLVQVVVVAVVVVVVTVVVAAVLAVAVLAVNVGAEDEEVLLIVFSDAGAVLSAG